ncbi:MAG: hypothetical protein ACSHW0_14560 [Thalassotalea sp.]
MVLLGILACVFLGVGLMVFFGEKHGKPMEAEQQAKLSKIAAVLVFVLIIVAIFKQIM